MRNPSRDRLRNRPSTSSGTVAEDSTNWSDIYDEKYINAGWRDANRRFLCRTVSRVVYFSIIKSGILGITIWSGIR